MQIFIKVNSQRTLSADEATGGQDMEDEVFEEVIFILPGADPLAPGVKFAYS